MSTTSVSLWVKLCLNIALTLVRTNLYLTPLLLSRGIVCHSFQNLKKKKTTTSERPIAIWHWTKNIRPTCNVIFFQRIIYYLFVAVGAILRKHSPCMRLLTSSFSLSRDMSLWQGLSIQNFNRKYLRRV